MIRSANGLSQSSPTFNKSNYDNSSQRSTMNGLNVVVVTVPSVSLTNSSTSVIVVSQSTTTTTTTITTVSSSVFSRNSRNTVGYRCSCKESTSHLPHRSGHYPSAVHYSQHFHHHNNNHHHHSSHKENYTTHTTAVVECSNSPTVSGTASSNSLSHHHSPHYSTHHYHYTSTVQQNAKQNSLQNKWKPVISRQLQEFMIGQWEQFHEQLLHSNSVDAKSCCMATTTATTTTTATSVITKAPTNTIQSSSGDSATNNNSALSSSDLTSSRTSLSDNSSSGQVTNIALSNSNSPSAVGTNINGRSRASDLPSTLTTSDITYGIGSSNNNNNNCCGVGVGSCSNYPRRKQSCGYGANQMGRSMNTGSLTWKRNLTSSRKNSSPGTFSSRCPANYFHNRSSSFVVNTTISNNLPPVTYISSSSMNSTSDQVNTISVNNQRNIKSLNVIDLKTASITPQSASIISVTPIVTSDGFIQQKISPLSSCSTSDSASKTDVCSPTLMNSGDLLKLEVRTENVNKVSDTRIESNNCVIIEQPLSDIHLINNNNGSSSSSDDDDDDDNTNDQLERNQFNEESINNSCIISSKSLLSNNETLTISMLKDEEIDCSVNSCGKIEEGECYWTPDPPASPENNTTVHGGSYSSSYHSSSLSPNSPPRQLSVSLPNSKILHTVYPPPPHHHPSSPSRHTDLSSVPDFYRCNQSVDSLLISSSNNRLESLNDVD
ncbi:hypothetical protein MN116_007534 [Schistosoma mekongi]|uniref:Uncharacterized protein n=1 Tax=Schistosoma mekongi TaxID=38744 RepID=A0AAE1Z7B8_SCHME|nr:hypothetical protein MN116_007534 [Schistosoma mekongi]